MGQLGNGLARTDGYGQGDVGGTSATSDFDGCTCSSASGEPVIDHDDIAIGNGYRWASCAIQQQATIEFTSLANNDRAQSFIAQVALELHSPVDDLDPVLTDRPHRELRVPRAPDLSHHQHIKYGVQRLRHRLGNG